ncbi:hypothetical protein HYH03_016091 [Edaphochlamys debaryana]|uniref:AAA+ ATPase domain-containing protein n=1 Tax=Edaphochlamys debaryana TaxID=47281 RepID=A0A836BQN2_9CHLO|nr:hypothetical protein HYH03_016091 [Edaphochlamys debaryana]|eukprot:KAG2485202.1 hypothetical protein HYH03_016091 [Edaphochlamys debaryana]
MAPRTHGKQQQRGLETRVLAALTECPDGTGYRLYGTPAPRPVARTIKRANTVGPEPSTPTGGAGPAAGPRAPRDAAAAREELAGRFPTGLWARSWQGATKCPAITARVASWQTLCTGVAVIIICAFCGVTRHGCADELAGWTVHQLQPGQAPPSLLHNGLQPAELPINGQSHLCPSCSANNRAGADCRLKHLAFLPPKYVQALCTLDPVLQMQLALVNVGAGFISNANGFFTARLLRPHAVPSVLLNWNPDAAARSRQAPPGLRDILGWSVAFNPLYRNFLSVAEQVRDDPNTPAPFLSPDAVRSFASDARTRGPLGLIRPDELRAAQSMLATVMANVILPSAYRRPPTTYSIGTLFARDGTPVEGAIRPDGSAAASSPTIPGLGVGVTAELALFPFLFPFGTGSYEGQGWTLNQYLIYRSMCLYSVSTLVQPYLMLMYTVRQTLQLYGGNTQAILEKAYREYMKAHPDATVAEALRHIIRYELPATMPHTPSWHRRHLLDLLALVDRWGMPTCFLTITADELSRTRWCEIDSMEGFLRSYCSSFTWRDASAENAYLFHRRCQLFMKRILRARGAGSAAAPLGRIQHHVIRYEVQNRQSLHAHILLWLHPDDVERVCSEFVACVPATYLGDASRSDCPTSDEHWEEPTEPCAKRLFHHVLRKQMHRCTEPKQPGCSHINIQRVMSSDWSYYVLKYAMKTEPTGQLNLADVSPVALGVPEGAVGGGGANTPYIIRLVTAFLTTTVISPTLSFLTCAGIPTIDASSPVEFIDSQPPGTRTRLVLRGMCLSKPPVEVYAVCPESLEAITFTLFFLNFVTVPRASRSKQKGAARPPPRQGPAGSTYVGDTMDGQLAVYQLAKPRIVRFSDPNPAADPEAYFYNLLLKHVPFRHEEELNGGDNDSCTYFEACCLANLVRNTSDLEAHIESYANYHLFNTQRRQAILASLLSKYTPLDGLDDDLDLAAATFMVTYGGLREPRTTRRAARSRPRHLVDLSDADLSAALAGDFADLDATPCTAAQQAVVDAVLRRSSGLIVLTGGPGSGKTFTTKKLTRALRAAGRTVHLSASTGAAAVRLSRFASTNHVAFELPVGQRAIASWAGAQSELSPHAEALRAADVFIIDEFSMMTNTDLGLILTRLFHAGRYPTMDAMLRNKLIVLVGDHAQLPPVCKCYRWQAAAATHAGATPLCEACHVASNPYFQCAPKFRLPVSIRHARDPSYAAFLDLIRTRVPTQCEIDAVFGRCSASVGPPPEAGIPPLGPMFVDAADVTNLAEASTTILCTHVEDAKKHNHAILAKLSAAGAVGTVYPVPIDHNTPPLGPTADALRTWVEEARFHTIEQVAIGARVVIVENCDLSKGAANGATAVVTALRFKEGRTNQHLVNGIRVRIDSTGVEVWIGQRTCHYRCISGGVYYRKSIPLALGWAITAHRAQGGTLAGPTIVHARHVFTPGQMYVMLSRVTERAVLKIVGSLEPEHFTPVILLGFATIDASDAEAMRAAATPQAPVQLLPAEPPAVRPLLHTAPPRPDIFMDLQG